MAEFGKLTQSNMTLQLSGDRDAVADELTRWIECTRRHHAETFLGMKYVVVSVTEHPTEEAPLIATMELQSTGAPKPWTP